MTRVVRCDGCRDVLGSEPAPLTLLHADDVVQAGEEPEEDRHFCDLSCLIEYAAWALKEKRGDLL